MAVIALVQHTFKNVNTCFPNQLTLNLVNRGSGLMMKKHFGLPPGCATLILPCMD